MDRNYIIKVTGNTPAAVALRKESVDRNQAADISTRRGAVALRKESVDRNFVSASTYYSPPVALRKESVDRNNF